MVAPGRVIATSKFPPFAAVNNVWNERSITRNTLSRRAFINIGKSVSQRSRQPIINSETARYNTATRYQDRYAALAPGCGELSYSALHFLPSRWIKLNTRSTIDETSWRTRNSNGEIYLSDSRNERDLFLYNSFRQADYLLERMSMEIKYVFIYNILDNHIVIWDW